MAQDIDFFKLLVDSLLKLEEDRVYDLVRQGLEAGRDPLDIINRGLVPGMTAVGEEFESNRYYLPELLLCAEIFRTSLDMVKPHLAQQATPRKDAVVIGTIQQDIHDIGKNVVKLMFELAGLEVHDLGIDVPCARFLEERDRTGAELLAASAMITSTMPGLKLLVQLAREKAPGALVMIGGAPVTDAVAAAYGADGTAPDCVSAVKVAQALIAKTRSPTKSA